MTEREYRRLHRDAADRPLGQRRIELLLAQLTLYVCKAWGGAKDSTVREFLQLVDTLPDDIDGDEDDEAAPISPEEARAPFGFNPKVTPEVTEHVEQSGSSGSPAGP